MARGATEIVHHQVAFYPCFTDGYDVILAPSVMSWQHTETSPAKSEILLFWTLEGIIVINSG